eukprot:5340116-Amphidinium_carterae.1
MSSVVHSGLLVAVVWSISTWLGCRLVFSAGMDSIHLQTSTDWGRSFAKEHLTHKKAVRRITLSTIRFLAHPLRILNSNRVRAPCA